jgi:DNA-binding response OmpR family regulator
MASMARRVLIVEDDPDLRAVVAAALRMGGYDPISAVTAEDGLSLLEDGRCDAAIVDVGLPRMDGLEALDAVSARWPSVPVIVATASPEIGEAQVLAQGASAFLRKPFSADQLLLAMAAVLKPATAFGERMSGLEPDRQNPRPQ